MTFKTDKWGTLIPEQSPEAEFTIEHRTSEIRDQKGELVVILEMELRDYPSRIGVFKLENLVFKSVDGQNSVRLQDLVPFSDTKILINKVRKNNYSSNPVNHEVSAPPMETGLDIGVLFHELGHAVQDTDERWSKYRFTNGIYAASVRNYPQTSLFDAIGLLESMKTDELLTAVDPDVAQQLINNRNEFSKESKVGSWRDGGYNFHEQKIKLQDDFLSEHFGATKVDLDSWISRLVAGDDTAFEEMKQVGIFLTSIEDCSYLKSDDVQLKTVQEQIKNDPNELRRVQIDALRQLRDALFVPLGDDTARQNIWIRIKKPSDEMVFAEANTDFSRGLTFNFPIRLTASLEDYSDFIRQTDELDEKHIQASEAYKLRNQAQDQLYRRTLELFLANEQPLIVDLDRPHKMIERDATRRALVWLRELKQKYSIDLTGAISGNSIAAHWQDSVSELGEEERSEYEQQIEKFDANPSISADLFLALRTYDAGKGQMKKEEKRKIKVPKKL